MMRIQAELVPVVPIGDADDAKTVGCWRKMAVGEPTT